ncbi:MAG: site-specific integrase [Coprobacter fastidiosus]
MHDADIEKLQRYCSDLPSTPQNLRLRALVALFLFQGLRQIEVVRLDVGDIDLRNKTAFIRGKGRDDKEPIHLHPSTVRVLREYLNCYRFRSGALFRSDSNHCRGDRLTTKSVREIIKRVFAKLEIDGSVHGFRHFFISKLIKSYKGELLMVSKYSRHRSIQMSRLTTRLPQTGIYPGFTKSLKRYGYEEATTPEYLLFGGKLENEPAVQTKRAPYARHIAECRRNKLHLPQVQHAGRVLRISAAIHVRTLPELYNFIHCLSR